MNIDLLADNPSVKWYFIVAIPFLVLVVGIALIMQNMTVIQSMLRSRRQSTDVPASHHTDWRMENQG